MTVFWNTKSVTKSRLHWLYLVWKLGKSRQYMDAWKKMTKMSMWSSVVSPFSSLLVSMILVEAIWHTRVHGLRTPREEKAFTARPKIQFQSQIFRYGRSIFCLPHQPNFCRYFWLMPSLGVRSPCAYINYKALYQIMLCSQMK